MSDQVYGKGKYFMKTGLICETFFKNGLANGPGIQTSGNGEIVIGTYKDGCMQGNSVSFMSNGDIFQNYI